MRFCFLSWEPRVVYNVADEGLSMLAVIPYCTGWYLLSYIKLRGAFLVSSTTPLSVIVYGITDCMTYSWLSQYSLRRIDGLLGPAGQRWIRLAHNTILLSLIALLNTLSRDEMPLLLAFATLSWLSISRPETACGNTTQHTG